MRPPLPVLMLVLGLSACTVTRLPTVSTRQPTPWRDVDDPIIAYRNVTLQTLQIGGCSGPDVPRDDSPGRQLSRRIEHEWAQDPDVAAILTGFRPYVAQDIRRQQSAGNSDRGTNPDQFAALIEQTLHQDARQTLAHEMMPDLAGFERRCNEMRARVAAGGTAFGSLASRYPKTLVLLRPMVPAGT